MEGPIGWQSKKFQDLLGAFSDTESQLNATLDEQGQKSNQNQWLIKIENKKEKPHSHIGLWAGLPLATPKSCLFLLGRQRP